ncbi:MAG: hypothetical protein IH595_03675 [Bacteroidales bacterium]|nr:hypothetical protein [Bacteroidales bacterium]
MMKQKDFFNNLWRENRERSDITKLQAYDPQTIYVSLIAKIENVLAEKIYSKTRQSIYDKFSNAYLYSPSQYHITVVGFPSVSELANLKVDTKSLNMIIAEAIDETPSIELELKNLNILPGTVIVEAYDLSGQLQSLTAEVSNSFMRLANAPEPVKSLRREKWWITLARLEANMKDLVSLVKRYRPHLFGKFRISTLEFVSTDKTFTLERTKTIASYKLQKDDR